MNLTIPSTTNMNILHACRHDMKLAHRQERDLIGWLRRGNDCIWTTVQYPKAGPVVSFPSQHQRFPSVWPPDHLVPWHKPYSSHMMNILTHQSHSHKSWKEFMVTLTHVTCILLYYYMYYITIVCRDAPIAQLQIGIGR